MSESATPPTSARPARVIAMLNQKGGVGKTTSAVNLGAALAREGKRVCLIDLDPQGHLTLHLGIDEESIQRTVYDLLIDDSFPVKDAIIRQARPRLDAILAEVDLAGAETELNDKPDRQHILKRRLDPVLHQYDVVLIDCPPSLGLLTLNALALADEIFVPMQAHFLALQGVGRLLETVGLVCQSVNPHLRVTGILLCMHEKQTTLAKEVVADLDAFFEATRDEPVPWSDCRVLRPPIRRNIKLAEAPSFGQTIFDYAPWCHGALDYRKLALGLIERWCEEETPLPPPPAPESEPESPEPAEEHDLAPMPDPPPDDDEPDLTPIIPAEPERESTPADAEPEEVIVETPAEDSEAPAPEIITVPRDGAPEHVETKSDDEAGIACEPTEHS